MKKHLLSALLSVGILQGCDSSCFTQQKSSADAKQIETPIANKNNAMENKSAKALSCKLTTPELQQRKMTVLAELKNKIQAKKELDNGFAYQFEGSDAMVDLLTDFMKTERQCCDFFDFRLSVNNDNAVWLDITGPEGAKDFIKAELDL